MRKPASIIFAKLRARLGWIRERMKSARRRGNEWERQCAGGKPPEFKI